MENDLTVPLTMARIDAANRLGEQLSGWQVTDDALCTLMCAFLGLLMKTRHAWFTYLGVTLTDDISPRVSLLCLIYFNYDEIIVYGG